MTVYVLIHGNNEGFKNEIFDTLENAMKHCNKLFNEPPRFKFVAEELLVLTTIANQDVAVMGIAAISVAC
jgi:hypothetical protein